MSDPTQDHTVATAAEQGSHLQLLEAMRNTIAREIAGGVPARDLASLSRRLQDLAENIDSIKTRLAQDEREQHPCPKCNGTGVASERSRAAGAKWQPT